MRQPIINVLTEIIRKSTFLLQRDLNELDIIQNSNRTTTIGSFVSHSCNKIKERIMQEINKYQSQDIGEVIFYQGKKIDNLPDGKYLFINLIDNLSNLGRALPFFCIEFTMQVIKQQNTQTLCCIIYFPAVGEIYFASSGSGAWVDKFNHYESKSFRLRIATNRHNDLVLLAIDISSIVLWNKITQIQVNNNPIRISRIRSFGSLSYACALLLSSKIDAIIHDFSSQNCCSLHAIKLLVTEAGGVSTSISRDLNVFHMPSIKIKVENKN